MGSINRDVLKLFIQAHDTLNDQKEGCLNVFSDSNFKRISKQIHKGLWYYGESEYCYFEEGSYVCRMKPSEIEAIAKIFK